jgi:tetratricopeptide (TPR) repeat protein
MERKYQHIRNYKLLEMIRGLLLSEIAFQATFKKYKRGNLHFADIGNWVDDRGKSPLFHLKEQSHSLFRNRGKKLFNKNEWLLDLVIGSIFHEAMKLRENIYQLEIYRPQYLHYKSSVGKTAYEKDYLQQFERIISKAEQGVLYGMAETRSLFHDAMEQLIDFFKENVRNPYLVRFLLDHQSLLQTVYGTQRVKEVFNLLFKKGLQEAYDLAGRSYLDSEHYDLSSHYFAKALKLNPHHNGFHFLLHFSRGMNDYYKNDYSKALSCWEKLISPSLRKYFKKHHARKLLEICHKIALELKDEGTPRLAQRVQSLADQIKKML